MPSSGARAGTTPNRNQRGAGTGAIRQIILSCGRLAVGQPAYTTTEGPRWWCDHCRTYHARRAA